MAFPTEKTIQVPANSNYVPEPMLAELMDMFETITALVSTLDYST